MKLTEGVNSAALGFDGRAKKAVLCAVKLFLGNDAVLEERTEAVEGIRR